MFNNYKSIIMIKYMRTIVKDQMIANEKKI